MSAARSVRHRMVAVPVVATLLLALLASSSRAPAAAAALPRLKGSNVITGTQTGSMRVVLEEDVKVPIRRLAAATKISGAGRATGFALIATRATGKVRPYYSAARVGFCGVAACAPTKDERAAFLFYDGDAKADDDTMDLPAGEYLLYVIADGAPVTVTLALEGLAGRSRLQPRGAADFEVTEPTVTVHETNSSTVYSNGDAFDMSGKESFSLNALRIRTTAWAGGEVAHCIYDEDPPPAPLAFAPGCPTGMNVPITDAVVAPVPYTRIYATGVARYGPGILGHGSWYAAAAAVEEADAVGFNLDFDALP